MPLRVVGNLGHDVVLALDSDGDPLNVPDLDLGLDLLLVSGMPPGEVSRGVGVDLIVVAGGGADPGGAEGGLLAATPTPGISGAPELGGRVVT